MLTSPRYLRAPELPAQPRHALVVATAHYQDTRFKPLEWVVNDAECMQAVLGDPEIGGCTVTRLVDRDEAAQRREISAFLKDRRPDDLTVLYFSCHGMLDREGRFYLVAADTSMDLLDATAIEGSWLWRVLNDCGSRHQLLILDCCYSGAYDPHGKAGPPEPPQLAQQFERPDGGRGRIVLTACRAGQSAHPGQSAYRGTGGQRLSVFTAALVEGLWYGFADLGRDGYIDHGEWYEYARKRVAEERSDQHPGIAQVRGEGTLRVARNRCWQVDEGALPAEIAAGLNVRPPRMRAGAVDELGALVQDNRRQAPILVAGWNELDRCARSDPSSLVMQRAQHWLDTLTDPWATRSVPLAGPGEVTEPAQEERRNGEQRNGEQRNGEQRNEERRQDAQDDRKPGTEGTDHRTAVGLVAVLGRRWGAVAVMAVVIAVLVSVVVRAFASGAGPAQSPVPGGSGASAARPACPPAGARGLLVAAGEQGCVGLIDAADDGDAVFGRDPHLTGLQHALLSDNELQTGDVTVVWFGSLTCDRYAPDDASWCLDTDGRFQYQAEREQLEALVMAKARSRQPGRQRIHVVIANSGDGAEKAADVAGMILQKRPDLGRLVVLSVSDSRLETKSAIEKLIRQGVPVVAPGMTADHAGSRGSEGTPAPPFVQGAGYLTLAPQNQQYASWVVDGLKAQYPTTRYPHGIRLVLYNTQPPEDYYTTSLVDDLVLTAAAAGVLPDGSPRVDPQWVTSTDEVVKAVCEQGRDPDRATVLFFADRWRRFVNFAQGITERYCGGTAVPLVIGDGSVDRVMSNDGVRHPKDAAPFPGLKDSRWPLLYFTVGLQCTELAEMVDLRPTDDLRRQQAQEALALLEQADRLAELAPKAGIGNVHCRDAGSNTQLGSHVAPTWDAIALGLHVVAQLGSGPSTADGLRLLRGVFPLAEGTITVAAGRVPEGTSLRPVSPLCVLGVGNSRESRSVNTCVNPRDDADPRNRGLGLADMVNRRSP